MNDSETVNQLQKHLAASSRTVADLLRLTECLRRNPNDKKLLKKYLQKADETAAMAGAVAEF